MYEAFYGLSGKPFQLNPDPNFYFGSRGHKRAFAYLEYGLVQGEGFIVITGEIGAGKTTVVQNLVNHLDRERVVPAQLVSTQLDADDLLRSVATGFGIRIKHEDKARMLAEIEAYLTALVLSRKRALLVVDEAQNLTPRAIEELRMLSIRNVAELETVEEVFGFDPRPIEGNIDFVKRISYWDAVRTLAGFMPARLRDHSRG